MNTPAVLAYALAIVLSLIALWDIYLFFHGGSVATVSSVVYRASLKFPPLLLATGFLLGHLFWPQTPQTAQDQIDQMSNGGAITQTITKGDEPLCHVQTH